MRTTTASKQTNNKKGNLNIYIIAYSTQKTTKETITNNQDKKTSRINIADIELTSANDLIN